MARDTDKMMVGGEALAAVLEKTKATIDNMNTSIGNRLTATEQKANSALQPTATYEYKGKSYKVSQLLEAMAKLMETTVVINE